MSVGLVLIRTEREGMTRFDPFPNLELKEEHPNKGIIGVRLETVELKINFQQKISSQYT